MDLLARRYASPFVILDEFIRIRQLHDFTIEIMLEIAKEKKHDARWQYYLHKVWDENISFSDYVDMCEQNACDQENKGMSQEEIKDVVEASNNLLDGFIPE